MLCIIVGESKEFIFIHEHLPNTANIIHNHRLLFKSLIKRPIFSITHNSRKICILPNFSHLP